MLLTALSLSFAQLGDRRIMGVFAKSMLITVLLCLALWVGLAKGVLALTQGWAAQFGDGAVLVDVIIWLLSFALVMLAFRAIAMPVTGLFGDDVVAAIEEQHYPQASERAVRAPLSVSVRLGLASLTRVVLINLLALPAYLFLIFTAIGPLILFVGVNAVLLGRDLAEMVAVRHLDGPARRQWLRNNRLDYALLGLAVTGLFLIPFVNLIAPIVGAGAATHLFHRRSMKGVNA
jgi:CysZ protein